VPDVPGDQPELSLDPAACAWLFGLMQRFYYLNAGGLI
jgi:hypothetical protein